MPVLIFAPLMLELIINNTGLGVIDYNLCATCTGIFITTRHRMPTAANPRARRGDVYFIGIPVLLIGSRPRAVVSASSLVGTTIGSGALTSGASGHATGGGAAA